MHLCGNPECKKELPKDREFCGNKCLRRYYELKQKDLFRSQFDKGSGSIRREYNIKLVAGLLEKGMEETEIRNRLGLWFKPSTVDDYVKNAKFLLSLKEKQED